MTQKDIEDYSRRIILDAMRRKEAIEVVEKGNPQNFIGMYPDVCHPPLQPK